MEVIVTIVSKLVYNLLKGLITYLYRGEIIQLVSTMDIPVESMENGICTYVHLSYKSTIHVGK